MNHDCDVDYSSSKICNFYFATATRNIVLKKRLPFAPEMEKKPHPFNKLDHFSQFNLLIFGIKQTLIHDPIRYL